MSILIGPTAFATPLLREGIDDVDRVDAVKVPSPNATLCDTNFRRDELEVLEPVSVVKCKL
jgi:hypothetical protein